MKSLMAMIQLEIVADVQMIDGQTNTYQWYQAEQEGQTEGGNMHLWC